MPVRFGGPATVAKILFPPAQGLTGDDAITVRGVAADPNGVAAVRGNGVLASSNDGYATWLAEIPLVDGDNAIVVEAEDRLGHVDSAAAAASLHLSRNRLRTPAAIT